MWWRWAVQRRTWTWLVIALVVRCAYFMLFLHEHGLYGAWYGWGLENGDTHGYFAPMDSWLRGEGYQDDYRMPGYGLLYLLLRSLTTPQGAGTGVLFLQCLLGAISVMVLARSARLLGASMAVQWTVCIAFACMGRVAVYDVQWFAESFCTSALIFGGHGVIAYRRTGSLTALLWTGGWMAWAVFLKPVMIIGLLAASVGVLISGPLRPERRIRSAIVLLLPFLLADGWWAARNWRAHQHLAPLTNGDIMPELRTSPMLPLMRFMQATGGNYLFWDPAADIRWLNMRDGPYGAPGRRQDHNVRLPEAALSTRITPDSLTALANDMRQWSDTTRSVQERASLLRNIGARSSRFIQYYREDRPWAYHVMSRVRLTALFFRQAGSSGLFAEPPKQPASVTVPLDLLEQVMHWTLLLGGLVAAIGSLFRWRPLSGEMAFLGAVVIVYLFTFPWVLRLCEGRYLVPIYPWLMLLAANGAERFTLARLRATVP